MNKKCIILSENHVNGTAPESTYRNIGAMEVAGLFRRYNIETTIIEWFYRWTDDELTEAIDLWFADSDEQIIGISTPFSLNIVFEIKHILTQAKKRYPKLQILIGGNRTHDYKLDEFVDMTFLGRSMETLIAWLEEQDLHRYATPNPQVVSNPEVKFDVDIPVLPPVTDGDMLNKNDILGFEIGIGCRFNCSFCSYDLRNVKNPLFVDSDSLRDFLQTVYDKYGVKNFYIADDTLNESDDKLEILATAIEQLTYEPNLVCYLRVDLLERRPQQYALLERIQLKGITLGLETLTPSAAKIIRKSPNIESTIDGIIKLKKLSPASFISSGMIVGLTGDTELDVYSNVSRLLNETIIHSVNPVPLGIRRPTSNIYDESYLSDFSKNPEKFGYTVYDPLTSEQFPSHITIEQAGSDMMMWENDWTNSINAQSLATALTEKIDKEKYPKISGFEWLILLAFDIVSEPADSRKASSDFAWQVIISKVKKYKRKYVQRKLDYLRNM